MTRNIYIYSFLLLAVFGLFVLYPELDLQFTNLFFEKGVFPLRNHPLVMAVYFSVRIITVLILLFGIAVLMVSFIEKKKFLRNIFGKQKNYKFFKNKVLRFNIDKKILAVIVLNIIITPGIIVHWVAKPAWDRARPVNVEQFGGLYKFSTIDTLHAGQMGNSFPSGHASMAFAVIALAWLLREGSDKRKQAYYILTFYAVIVSLVRVVQGGHFLSDVAISALLTLLTSELLKRLIVGRGS